MVSCHKFTIENKLFGHCATCDHVIVVDRNSELKTRRIYHSGQNVRIEQCPTCSNRVDINNNRFSRFALYTEFCKLSQSFQTMQDQLNSIDKRLTMLEFTPPNGTEFQRILKEAQDAGDMKDVQGVLP